MLRVRVPRIASLDKTLIGGGGIPNYEYHPYHLELKRLRELEAKAKKAEIKLKTTETKIENLEAKRSVDLANQYMQRELFTLLKRQQELKQLIEDLEQEKLKVMRDDEDFLSLLMYIV